MLFVGAALLRFYGLSAESLWFDEAYSVWVARHSVGWHFALSTQRIFPPLYYLLLHCWLALGQSEFVVRSLSALIGVGSVTILYLLTRELFDERTALLSSLLLAVSPLHIWYSQEARMYVLVAGLGLLSAYCMWLALREGRLVHWLAYVGSTALLLNTHYFAVFLVPFQNAFVLYLLLQRRVHRGLLSQWLCSQAAVGMLSAVGLAGIFSAESSYWWGVLDTWHGAPNIVDLLGVMFAFSLGSTLQGRLVYWGVLFLFGFCIMWGMRVTFRRGLKGGQASRLPDAWRRGDGLVFVLLYLLIPMGLVFVVSQFQSFWVLRYVFPFLPAYCILVGLGISSLPNPMAASATGLILLLSLSPLADMYRREQKENWRGVTAYIEARQQPADLILLVDEDIWIPFDYYYHSATRQAGISRSMSDRELIAARVGALLPGHERIWLVLSHTDNWLVRDYLQESAYTERLSEEEFTGVRVELFRVELDDAQAQGANAMLRLLRCGLRNCDATA